MKAPLNPKQFALDIVNGLPASATIEDLKYEFSVIIDLLAGLRDIDEGRTIPHEQVMAEVREWISKSTGRREHATT